MKRTKSSQTLLSLFMQPQASVKDRMAAGKALRKTVPRASHAEYVRSGKRTDAITILEKQAETRLSHLVPVRHARMLESEFSFLRGSAAIMAKDLASTPITGTKVQACGDMHVSNFGMYASAERNLVFAINDFDETYPAPWEFDLKRLTTSAVVAMDFIAADKTQQRDAALAVCRSYREHMRLYAEMGFLEIWYESIDMDDILSVLSPAGRRTAKTYAAKARKRTHLQVLGKMSEFVNDKHRIIEARPVIVREKRTEAGRPIREALGLFLESYMASLPEDRRELLSHYRIVDVARKVVGVGSVGTRCWVMLMRGTDDDDPLFLQIKEAQPSVLAPFCDEKISYATHGQRVVVGQRLIQGSPDIFLGWGKQDNVHFYVRQLRDMKGSTDIVPGETPPKQFREYCALCGWALALAHAKSGHAAFLSGYMGSSDKLDQAFAEFSFNYAKQNRADYEAMQEAAHSGRIEVSQSHK
jgi:uncharacterized protein (DUF2252 family)